MYGILLKIRRRLHLENVDLLGPLAAFGLKALGLYERGVQNALNLQVTRIELDFQGLPEAFDGYTILHISDVHLDGFPAIADVLLDALSEVDADLAVFTGDYHLRFCKDWRPVLPLMEKILRGVRTRDGVWGVRGNHDPDELLPHLEELGLPLLHNRAVKIPRGGEELVLAGVDDPHYFEAADLRAALDGVPKHSFVILLAHTPELYREAARQGVDLYLCGHTHGGQIQVRGIGPLFLNIRAPRRLGSGLWRYRGMWGYTNLGAGNTAVPVRIGCRPEIALIRLRRQPALDAGSKSH